MAFVAAHTNVIGRAVKPVNPLWEDRYKGSAYWSPLGGSLNVAWSYKSPTMRGAIHPVYKDFKMATSYSRCIARLDSLTAVSFETNSYFVRGGSSAHASGVSALAIGFDSYTGVVSVSANTVNRAYAEARNKVLDQKINLGTALAEATKTVDWLSTRIKDLVVAIKLLRKGQFARLYAHLRKYKYTGSVKLPQWKTLRQHNFKPTQSADSVWLEFWYAFMPLVYDISGALEQFDTGFKERSLLFSVERTVSKNLNPRSFIGGNTAQHLWVAGTIRESAKVTLWGAVTVPSYNRLNQLGFINPAVVAWEVVPFSFVIDWLIPVGDFLQSLTATVGVDFVDGHVMRRVHGKLEGINNSPLRSTYGVPKPGGTFPRATLRILANQRSILLSFPWVHPYWKNPFSTNHVVTAISLITTLRK